jgi:hypothetical protein
VDDENDFVMSHAISFWIDTGEPPRMRFGWGKVVKAGNFIGFRLIHQGRQCDLFQAFPASRR